MRPTQEDIEKAVIGATKDASIKLKESPISLSVFKATQIGYYNGYCDANGWTPNEAVIKTIDGA